MKLLVATLLHIFGFSLVFIGAYMNDTVYGSWDFPGQMIVVFMIMLGIIDIIISFYLFYLCYKEHKENKK